MATLTYRQQEKLATWREALAKRWAARHGLRGNKGGWIGADIDGSFLTVCQGYRALYHLKRNLIWAEIEAGK